MRRAGVDRVRTPRAKANETKNMKPGLRLLGAAGKPPLEYLGHWLVGDTVVWSRTAIPGFCAVGLVAPSKRGPVRGAWSCWGAFRRISSSGFAGDLGTCW